MLGLYNTRWRKEQEVHRTHWPTTYPATRLRLHNRLTYIQPTYPTPYAPTYIPTLHTYSTNLRASTHYLRTNPTKAPTPYIPTLHYIPVNPSCTKYLQTPTCLPCPYIPSNPYNPYTLHCMPALPLRTCSMSMLIGSAAAIYQ